jgi:hypothetical protein
MNSDDRNEHDDALDRAMIARLSKLRTKPVDTSNLDKALRARIPVSRRPWRVLSLRPIRAAAASLVLVSAIVTAIMLSASSGPALAEPAQMAQVHHDIVSGRFPVMRVDSIEAANRMLNSQSPDAPTLPQVPDTHVMACCMKSIHNKKMACVLLKNDGVPITLAVASAADMKLGPAPVLKRNGIDYRMQTVGNLNMVMTEHDGKWLCLMGEVPADRLTEVAAQVRF